MLLKEVAPPAPNAIPLPEFAAHLRLGFGFTDDGSEDALLNLYLRRHLKGRRPVQYHLCA